MDEEYVIVCEGQYALFRVTIIEGDGLFFVGEFVFEFEAFVPVAHGSSCGGIKQLVFRGQINSKCLFVNGCVVEDLFCFQVCHAKSVCF